MRQIVYALTVNENPPPLLDRQLERFVQRMRDDMEDVIWTANFQGLALGAELYEEFSQLGNEKRIQLFLSPDGFEAIYSALRDGSEGSISRVVNLVKFARINDRNANQWDANAPIDCEKQPEKLLLGGTISVDIGSELCRRVDPTSPVFLSDYEVLTSQEAERIRSKLNTAFSEIEEFAPSLARMIRNYTRTIYVRKVGDLVPSSEQVDTELGAIRLRNLHSDLYHHDQVVDDLIHESTHNLLGTFEYLNFPFIQKGCRPSSNIRPVSPWSMRSIQVLPFLHASFVYFGMLNYTQKRLSDGIENADERKRFLARRNRYASGFLMPGKLSDFASSLTKIDPRVVQAIDWMQSSVRARAVTSIQERSSKLVKRAA